MTGDESAGVLAYVPDLMDQSRIRAAIADVTFVRRAADLLGRPARMIIVDLARPDTLDVVSELSVPTLGFAPHVDEARLDDARAAGFDEALPRSVFFRRIAEAS